VPCLNLSSLEFEVHCKKQEEIWGVDFSEMFSGFIWELQTENFNGGT